MSPLSACRLGLLALLLPLTACAHRVSTLPPEPKIEFDRYLTFYDHPLRIHFARPEALTPGAPLLLYATGDGGWRGKDEDTYRHMIRWGYPVAGFSAPDYLNHLGFVSGTTTPGRLALDYERLIGFAKEVLKLPAGTTTILVGVSRGAGLAVVAAGRHELRREVSGVLAVGLTKEEEYVRHYRIKRGRTPADMPKRELVTFETYESLGQLRSIPLAVVQSTHDNYLPAADARQLFGPDTDTRRLVPIDSKNHSFRGARDLLYATMADELDWICGRTERTLR